MIDLQSESSNHERGEIVVPPIIQPQDGDPKPTEGEIVNAELNEPFHVFDDGVEISKEQMSHFEEEMSGVEEESTSKLDAFDWSTNSEMKVKQIVELEGGAFWEKIQEIYISFQKEHNNSLFQITSLNEKIAGSKFTLSMVEKIMDLYNQKHDFTLYVSHDEIVDPQKQILADSKGLFNTKPGVLR